MYFICTKPSPGAQVTFFRFPPFPPAIPPGGVPFAPLPLAVGTLAGEFDSGSFFSFIAFTISAKGSTADGIATSSPPSPLGVEDFVGGGIDAFLNEGSLPFAALGLGAEKNEVSAPAPFVADADDDEDDEGLDRDIEVGSFLTVGFVDVDVPTAGFLDGGALPDAPALELDDEVDDAEGGSFRFFETPIRRFTRELESEQKIISTSCL